MQGPSNENTPSPNPMPGSSPTTGTGDGPYYVANTPELPHGNLNVARLPGETVRVDGYVFGGPTAHTPLAGAKIEIWQADASGSYHPNAPGDAAKVPPDQLALRGYVVSDASGYYQFSSIYPGKYPGRCRHFHVRASAAGHRGVSTQLIVPSLPGDDRTPENDPIALHLPAENHLQFVVRDGAREARFDFRLAEQSDRL
jgi:protocatechuate 3,4-dioxygenase beta subunit